MSEIDINIDSNIYIDIVTYAVEGDVNTTLMLNIEKNTINKWKYLHLEIQC